MPVFIFHLCRADGASPAFEAFELADDNQVLDRAMAMLEQHRSCDHVAVWNGDEFVLRLDRAGQKPR